MIDDNSDFGPPMDPFKFKPQLTNIWVFQKPNPRYGAPKDPEFKYGRIAGQIVENLLYYFTNTGDVVLDPMVGTGTTIDVCKAWNRQCLAFDIEPYPKRNDIVQNDLLKGLPDGIPKAHLAFLDPLYFNMKVRDAFTDFRDYVDWLRNIVNNTVPGVRRGGHIALINCDQTMIGDESYQLVLKSGEILDNNPDLRFKDTISIPLIMATQYMDFDVARAKKNKKMLGVNRQMFVFQKKGVER